MLSHFRSCCRTDDDFLREVARLENDGDWMQAEREFRLCHWKGAQP